MGDEHLIHFHFAAAGGEGSDNGVCNVYVMGLAGGQASQDLCKIFN